MIRYLLGVLGIFILCRFGSASPIYAGSGDTATDSMLATARLSIVEISYIATFEDQVLGTPTPDISTRILAAVDTAAYTPYPTLLSSNVPSPPPQVSAPMQTTQYETSQCYKAITVTTQGTSITVSYTTKTYSATVSTITSEIVTLPAPKVVTKTIISTSNVVIATVQLKTESTTWTWFDLIPSAAPTTTATVTVHTWNVRTSTTNSISPVLHTVVSVETISPSNPSTAYKPTIGISTWVQTEPITTMTKAFQVTMPTDVSVDCNASGATAAPVNSDPGISSQTGVVPTYAAMNRMVKVER